MIGKDSKITKELVELLFKITHKRWYVEHALSMIKDEEQASKIINFLKDNQEIEWQDIEYQILINN